MTASELERIAYGSPFRPFRVNLRNGDILEIKRSLRTTIAPDRVFFGVDEDPSSGIARQLRVISLTDIASVEVAERA